MVSRIKRYVVVIAAALLLFAGGIGFGTAYFSDVAKSHGNVLSTGTFDIGISKDGRRYYSEARIFDFSGLTPGDNRSITFYIKNRGDYSVSRVTLLFNVTDRENGKLSGSEALVDKTPNVGELSGNIVIKDFHVEAGGKEMVLTDYTGKTLKELNSTTIEIFRGNLPKGGVLRITIDFQLSPTAGNECQTDTAEVGMVVYAEQ